MGSGTSSTTVTFATYVTSGGGSWAAGFACAIIATLLQAAALALIAVAFCAKADPKQQVVMSQNNFASGYSQNAQSRV